MARKSQRARRTSPLHLPSAFELYKPSKEIVLKNIWIFGPLYAISLILGLHGWLFAPAPGQVQHWWTHGYGVGSSWPGSPLPSFGASLIIGFSALWAIFVLVVGTVATIMSQAAQLDAAEHRHLDFQDLWKTCRQVGLNMLGLYLVLAGIIGVGLLLAAVIGIGLIVLLVPGLILARRYFLAPYVMIDKNAGIRESLDESARLTAINPGSIWGIFGVMLIIGLVSFIPFVGSIVAFALGCLYSVAPALRYQQLKRIKHLAL